MRLCGLLHKPQGEDDFEAELAASAKPNVPGCFPSRLPSVRPSRDGLLVELGRLLHTVLRTVRLLLQLNPYAHHNP
jgi:hypothetical protein